MKKQNISPLAEASTKFNLHPVNFQFDLPMVEIIMETKAEIEALSAQAGLKIIHHFLEEEIQQRCGSHGQQNAYATAYPERPAQRDPLAPAPDKSRRKTADNHKIGNGKFLASQSGRWIALHRAVAGRDIFVDGFDAPKLVAGFALERHQFTRLRRQARQPHRFRQVFLENETELLRFLQRLHLGGDSFAESLVGNLRNQVFNFRHADKAVFARVRISPVCRLSLWKLWCLK